MGPTLKVRLVSSGVSEAVAILYAAMIAFSEQEELSGLLSQ